MKSENPKANAVELDVEGMTCAACAVRIEKNLNKLDGVEASVSLATEKAVVRFSSSKTTLEEILGRIRDSGYDASVAREGEIRDHSAEHRAARNDFLVAALLSAPFLVEMTAMAMGPHGLLPAWLQWLLATPVQFWSGRRFYGGAWKSLRGGTANMDVLVALGTSAAYGFSVFLLFSSHGNSYFEASAVVITLVLLGKYLEMRAKAAARRSLEGLIRLQPSRAMVEKDGQWVEADVASIVPGRRFLARPGDAIAVDGRVAEGESAVNEAMLTGEAMPVVKHAGAMVYAGTVNGAGALQVVATGIGKDTVLAGIIRLVGAAQASKPPVQKLVDQVSAIFVPTILVLSAFTFLYWFRSAGFSEAIVPAIAVLVIACPCALGLATPTALIVGVGRAARAGILIRNADALEAAEKLDTLVLDKTGTLTLGEPAVTDVLPEAGVAPEELLSVASSLGARSEHPLARAILRKKGAASIEMQDFRSHGGKGISAKLDGKLARLGAPGFLDRQSPPLPGKSVVGVELDGRFLGWIALADELRPTAAPAIAQLRTMGIEPVIVSGDREEAVAAVAAQLGIARWRSGVLPEGKVREIQVLREEQRFVGMAGDGVNDAPALAAADVSFAVASGSGVALDVADVTLMNSDLAAIADAIRLSRATLSKIRQNLFFAFIYNVLGIPLAALGMLDPMIAGAAMALSSVSVVSNSLLLNRWKQSS